MKKQWPDKFCISKANKFYLGKKAGFLSNQMSRNERKKLNWTIALAKKLFRYEILDCYHSPEFNDIKFKEIIDFLIYRFLNFNFSI